ncbi:dynein cytoplasmic heavy chain beethoven isoform X2 [Rhynchophorus ferrugineus]|uniref:dynein cytoplasmic heavy chain beethoven isoform X2 n=1 Tax=Rhynchophorus ferrugineus TaxID=354439 RepID=UPI003FCDE56A
MLEYIKDSILQITGLQLGVLKQDNLEQDVEGLSVLDSFLANKDELVLYGVLEEKDSSCIRFYKQYGDSTYGKMVVFSKRSPCVAGENFMKDLQVNTVFGSPVMSLYDSLNKVFAPLFQKGKDPDINRKIATLQSNLRATLISENPHFNIEDKYTKLFDLSYSNSLNDEIAYWRTFAQSKSDKVGRKRAENFVSILTPISQDLSFIEALPITEVEDQLERCYNVLDDLWRQDYDEERTKHLMDVIGYHIWKHTVKQLKDRDVFEDDFNRIGDLLSQSISVCDKWLGSCKQLTELLWPNYTANPWKGAPYQPRELTQFQGHLRQVLKIRMVHKQLARLSTDNELDDLDNGRIFKPFKNINVLSYDGDEEDLGKANKEFEYLLQPAEKRVALKLKTQLVSVNSNIRQLIYEFTRYSELICRPVLKKILQPERQFLLSSLHDYVSQIQSQINSGSSGISSKQDTSDIVREVIYLRQLDARVDEVISVIKTLLDDLEGFTAIFDYTTGVSNDIKTQTMELFESWCSDAVTDINGRSLSLNEDDPVVEFSRDKLMKVNYPARLVTLIAEVRQFKAMGYRVSGLIDDTAEHAKRFMRFARILEQVANFHNTIGSRMVPSQKPMMLSSALELSKLVQEQEVVSWGNEKAVEKYVDVLKRAVDKLSRNNNLLTSYHIEIVDKINELEDVSLLRDFPRWRDAIKDVRAILDAVEGKGFKNMQSWKGEIDARIGTILENEYVKNLSSLHLDLHEIRVDLVYRGGKLDFSPPRQSLGQMYEQQLRRYLDIPKTFEGVSDDQRGGAFGGIIERNAAVLEKVSKKKLELLDQLEAVKKHWESWLQLEHLDTKKLTSWQHWDLHFRASKTFGQEIAKLPSTEEKVGCFLVGLSRLRSDLESHNRSYWDQLVYSLKDSIAEDVVKLQNYIDPSTGVLTKQPLTLDELGQSDFDYNNITSSYNEMEAVYNEMVEKSKILSGWSREQVDAVNRIKGAWERLGSLISNHQHIMAKQMETARTTLNVEKENLLKQVERFEAKWNQMKTVQNSLDPYENTIEGIRKQFKEVQDKRAEWDGIVEKRTCLVENYARFKLDVPDIVVLSEVEQSLVKEEESWRLFEEFYSEFQSLGNEYWLVYRKKLFQFEDFIKDWQERLVPEADLPYVSTVLQELQRYKVIVPVLKYVKGDDFSEKHWSDVFELLRLEPRPVEQLLVKDFLSAQENLQNHVQELQSISKRAASEIVVRQAMREIEQWEIRAKFVLFSHKDSRGKDINLIKEYKEVLNAIGDHQILLQSLKNSADFSAFEDKVNTWERKLDNLNTLLHSLAQVQKKWLYLEPIFGRGTLINEKSRFERLDRDFRRVVSVVEKDPRVTELCRHPDLIQIVQNISDQLSRCQHSLDDFLEEKRQAFPRFLFLSDDDLLEVIGHSSSERVIQSHLKKLFAGVHGIQVDQSGQNVVAICSGQGEVVPLSKAVSLVVPVEQWLGNLVVEMQATLRSLLVSCQKEVQAADPLKYPSQILCLSDSITFTTKCEQAIGNVALPSLLVHYKAQLQELSSLDLSSSTKPDGDDVVLELKRKALVLDTIHHIGVLEELIGNKTTSVADWTWQKQLRYYSNVSGNVTIKIGQAIIDYAFEYLGNEQKLVSTPLTERCFLTLTQAMHLGLGGNPYGPAGTGKTESVKALGSILGRQVLVFNCDEGIDSSSMGRILTGLVKTGAWGCFDEFNRLDEATLSAVSTLIQSIQEALRRDSKTVTLLDREVTIDKHCGVFVTLNPAGGGYGGRNKLPDNLKQLFRPVVMTHPDHEQIARTLLYCDGYGHADVIARKIIEVFQMSSKLLSKQSHYDWGLRAIKTVLSGCQTAIKQKKIDDRSPLTVTQELTMVASTLKMDVVSKLTFLDSVRFYDILKNCFKDISIEDTVDDALRKAILQSYHDLKLIVNEKQVNKCLEFYKQLKQRMGVALIGPPGSGKTTIIRLMEKALIKINQKMKLYPLNPKSMSRKLLLGHTDQLNQWNDGVLTSYSAQVSGEASDVWSWIWCDGDLDPEWVESLNSVMDDNRLMTLPSGWRIHFSTNVNFVFETDNLVNASPATISRLGIVYLSAEDISIDDYIRAFLNTLSEESRLCIGDMVSENLKKAIDWVINDGETTLRRSPLSVTRTALSLLKETRTKSQFIIALLNGLGQQLLQDFRDLFTQQVFEWMDETPPSDSSSLTYDSARDIITVNHTDPNAAAREMKDGSRLVVTGQVQQYLDVLDVWLGHDWKHFLLIGQHGSAKGLLVNYVINDRSNIEVATVYCNAYLTPEFVIYQLQQHCFSVNTFKGKVLRPKKGQLMLFFRDLHLLKPDRWGTNVVIEFLSQLVEYKGFFDDKTEFVGVENIVVVGTLAPNQKVSTRFTSKLQVLNVNVPDKEDLSIILVACLMDIINTSFPHLNYPKAKVTKLASPMIAIYEKIKGAFASYRRKHYIITPHDLTLWCSNLKFYSISESNLPEIICYECLKIFGDRLTNDDEKHHLYSLVDDWFRTNWSESNITQRLGREFYAPRTDLTGRKMVFEKYCKEDWLNEVERGVTQFGKEHYDLEVIVNEPMLSLTAAVLRTATISNQHMLLVGKAGVGRKTSLKIASALSSVRIIHPISAASPYFYNDLKLATQRAGIECEQVFLILEDYMFTTDQNCNTVDLLICSGFIPDLYTPMEMETLLKGLKDRMEMENFEGDLHQFFANNVRKNLRVFACLDEDNERIWEIVSNCPAFSQKSSMLCLSRWDSDTMKIFPSRLTSLYNDPRSSFTLPLTMVVSRLDDDGEIECSKDFPKILEHIPDGTPSRFVSLIKLYCEIYRDKKKTIRSRSSVLEAGVSKLTAAKDLVGELKQKAAVQQEKLAEKQSKANSALDMISNTMKGANEHKEEMEGLKKKTEAENVQLMKRKAEIEQELSEVEPLIQEARSAVGNIKTEALSEIRSLRAPPEIIRDILEGVLRLMGTQDTSWNSMKTFLAKRGIKEEIRSFDAGRIQTENRLSVEKLMATKKDSFDPKMAKRASVAAAPLAAWVSANVQYSKVLDKIRPLEREQNKLKQNLDNAKLQLGELSAGLMDVDATVAKLKEQLAMYTKEAAEIEIGLNQATETLRSAEDLVFKLEDEYRRWQQQLVELSEEISSLQSNALLASAFVVFLSEKSDDNRVQIMSKWREALGSTTFDFIKFFSTEREQLQWQTEGLASDRFAMENALVIKKCFLTPLITDPTSSAVHWIKTHFGANKKNFDFTSPNSPKFNTILETSVRFGKILLVEELEELPQVLYPLVKKQAITDGERKMIKILGKYIDYHSEFRLILCSRNEHIKQPADIAPYLTVLNFNVTYTGFIEQLLSAAIKQEKPDLETRRKELLQQNEELQEKLYLLQNDLLESLANSQGNILNDKNLLATLNDTKASSTAVSQALEESKQIRAQLREDYELYLEISTYGSKLYFACNEFSEYNTLYSLSADAYNRIFLSCLQTVQSIDQSLGLQKKHLFQSVYNYMARGMFKKDRLSFLLHSVYKMYPNDIPKQEMDLFLDNAQYKIAGQSESMDLPSWVPPLSSLSFSNLMRKLPDLMERCQVSESHLWSTFIKNPMCEKEFPSHCRITEFQKVLLVESLRPDRLLSSIELCLLKLSGLTTIDPPVLNLSNIYKESNSKEPILLLATPGSDPSTEILELAKQLGQSFEEIPMGAGQESKAVEILERCVKNGHWLILKNLHLVTYWLPVLAQSIKDLDASNNFRLWLISEPSERFNFVLSNNSLKIAYEEPQGIGNNMQRIYTWLAQRYGTRSSPNAARLFFVFSCFHALVQERRNYIPQGWYKFYEFNQTDIQTSLSLTEPFWKNDIAKVPWTYLRGLLNGAVYGGRVEVADDTRVLESYLKTYFRDDVLSHRWKPLGLNLSLPSTSQIQEYVNILKQLPKKDPPSIFGLPDNVDKAREKQSSLDLISNLKAFYLKQTQSSMLQHNANYKELSPIFSLWKKLNQGQDYIRLTSPNTASYDTAVESFIAEEYSLGLSLVHNIHKSLMSLNKISKGIIDADENDVHVMESLMYFKTPKLWLNIWDGPKEPTNYFRAVIQRMNSLSTWKGEKITERLANPVKLVSFFNPEAFIASTKQDFSREKNISLDDLTLQTQWHHGGREAIILSDLLIEGGVFENKILKKCENHSDSISPTPDCYLYWVEKVKASEAVSFPLYINSTRERKIAEIQVDCDLNERDQWFLTGLAFYLEY